MRYAGATIGDDAMADQDGTDREKVVVERGGSVGGIIAAIALLIAVLGVLKYFGMLPF